MSFISLLDADLALVYSPLMPAAFRRFLEERGFSFVEVPDAEYDSMGTNTLATAPRECLMIEGNPVTQQRLEQAGCKVATYRGREISLNAEGGPTCLTRPILRGR
jgi:N-dimethylarginine dimethylaminohydrolase